MHFISNRVPRKRKVMVVEKHHSVLKIEKSDNFAKEGDDILLRVGWVESDRDGLVWVVVLFTIVSRKTDAILSRMPANNPPPLIILACTSSTYSVRKLNRECPTCNAA